MIEIPLTKGYVALIDEEDEEAVRQYSWRAMVKSYTTYAFSLRNGVAQYMHRVVLPGAQMIDHIDHNGLNNTRDNLRACTAQMNCANSRRRPGKRSEGYRGVRSQPRRNGWQARIKVLGKDYYLGTYDTPIDAAKAYDRAAFDAFGEFATLNFPEALSCLS